MMLAIIRAYTLQNWPTAGSDEAADEDGMTPLKLAALFNHLEAPRLEEMREVITRNSIEIL